MQYTIVGSEHGSNITVFLEGQAPLVAHSSHPTFNNGRTRNKAWYLLYERSDHEYENVTLEDLQIDHLANK